jgi:hypothetical protein
VESTQNYGSVLREADGAVEGILGAVEDINMWRVLGRALLGRAFAAAQRRERERAELDPTDLILRGEGLRIPEL